MAWMELEFSFLYFLQTLHNPVLDQIMVSVSSLGNVGWMWVVLSLVLFCAKRTRKIGFAMLLSMLIGFLLGNVLLKNLIARQRPCWIDQSVALLVVNPHDYSFPSGHSLASFAAATSIFLQDRRWGIPALCLAAAIAFSRLYLFVHFPSDVLTGIIMGIVIAYFVWKGIEKGREHGLQRR